MTVATVRRVGSRGLPTVRCFAGRLLSRRQRRLESHGNQYLRAVTRRTDDVNKRARPRRTLTHAHQPEAGVVAARDVEATTIVVDERHHLTFVAGKINAEVRCTRVLEPILNGSYIQLLARWEFGALQAPAGAPSPESSPGASKVV